MKGPLVRRRLLDLGLGFLWRVLWLERFFLPVLLWVLGSWALALTATLWGYIPLYIGRLVFSPQDVRHILLTTALVTLFGGGYLLRRVLSVRSLLDHAVPISGRVSRVARRPLAFQVEYFFTYQHQSYTATATVRRHRVYERHPALRPGHTVTVLVHQFDPSRSLLRELYEPLEG